MTQKKPSDYCETPVELNSIKESLNKIPDTELALDILTNLENLGVFVNKQSEALKDAQAEVNRIQGINQTLMIRAIGINSAPAPTNSVNYDAIDPTQSIIDRI